MKSNKMIFCMHIDTVYLFSVTTDFMQCKLTELAENHCLQGLTD